MTTPQTHREDDLLQAATLAFAMVRFASGAAHPARHATPAGLPRVGVDAYDFMPGARCVPVADVPRFLASQPSPALLIPTTTRGVVALILLRELEGERAASMRHELENQQAGLEELVTPLGLTAASRVLLEFDGETHIVSLAVLRRWSERFGVHVGWNITRLADDARVAARLNLFRSDGVNSAGIELR